MAKWLGETAKAAPSVERHTVTAKKGDATKPKRPGRLTVKMWLTDGASFSSAGPASNDDQLFALWMLVARIDEPRMDEDPYADAVMRFVSVCKQVRARQARVVEELRKIHGRKTTNDEGKEAKGTRSKATGRRRLR